MNDFIDRKIDVRTAGVPLQPVEFTWNGTTYVVEEILHQWMDWGFGAGTPQRSWRTRRHRSCFRVRVRGGEQFELYVDRGTGLKAERWYLLQRLQPGTSEEGAPS